MNGGTRRVASPSGGSTLITSAPRSASIRPHSGPETTRDTSTTRVPESGAAPSVTIGPFYRVANSLARMGDPIVATAAGRVRGVAVGPEGAGVLAFKGVPYGAPTS